VLLEAPLDRPATRPARRLRARTVRVPVGDLDFAEIVNDPRGWTGLLVIEGFMLVGVRAGRARTGWLIGAEDLLRPWDTSEISVLRSMKWRALTPTCLALLDSEFGVRAAAVPMFAQALMARSGRTTNWLLAKSLVLASPVVEDRLLLAFALFGERWGIVTPDGVRLRLPLTHALLATLCGVTRPSVTLGLKSLEQSGVLSRTPEGAWLLRRGYGQLGNTRPSCWPAYTAALGLQEPPAALGDPLVEDEMAPHPASNGRPATAL
jgi:hypothetical protein